MTQSHLPSLTILAITLLYSSSVAGRPRSDTPAPAALLARLTADEPALESYQARRRLSASTRRGQMSASLLARTALRAGRFQYDILEEQGSAVIRNKVLKSALDAERDVFARHASDQAALSPRNYEFLDVVDDETVLRLRIRPLRRHVLLLKGALLFDPASGDMIGIEGEPSQRPSFWTRRVSVSRRFSRIGGVRVPVSMESRSDVLIVGASSFTMRWCYEAINDQPIDDCGDDSAAMP